MSTNDLKTKTTFVLTIRRGQQQPQALHFESLLDAHDYVCKLNINGCIDFTYTLGTIQTVDSYSDTVE